MRALRTICSIVLLTSISGCGLIDRVRGGDTDDQAPSDDAELVAADQSDAAQPPAPKQVQPVTGLDRFKHWTPRHAFLNSPTIFADVISDSELIVATKDAHIGVSQDSGGSWKWTRTGDTVRAVTGFAGGPYVALHEGALSLSDDGLRWRRLPRHTADSLIGVVAADIGVVAIGNNGGFVHFAKDGSAGHSGSLPDKFKPKALTELNGAVLAWAGKRGYGTTDGRTWTELETLPPIADGRGYLTSAGSCSIAKVGKRRGVACTVSGTAYGIGEEFIVENKGVTSLTRDGGETWTTAALPFKGANAVFGAAGGPYYAVGNNGAVAISKDGGVSWIDQKWEASANLVAGLVDGKTVIIVGAKGTLIYSTNGGDKWENAQPPIGPGLVWVGRLDGDFVVSDGRKFASSTNAADWVEAEPVELPAKPGPCTKNGPEDNQQCRWNADVTTPEGIPEVRGLSFRGDVGLAIGDTALVGVTTDGGASWTTAHGLGLGRFGATSFSVRGDQLLATDGARLLVSTDAGDTWSDGEMVRKYTINAVHFAANIGSNGTWFAAARDEVLAAKVSPKLWLPAADEPLKGDWRALFEVSDVIYVAGSKGQLLRSPDGNSWRAVATGLAEPVIAMAGEGDEVWAVTGYSRKRNNVLLRSEDGGEHFIVVGELASATDQPDLRVRDGAVHWGDLLTRDQGQSWTRETERYFPGLVDVQDGSGIEIANLVYRYGRDRLYVVTGPGERDWVRIDSAFNDGGVIACDPGSGCWMLAAGVLYRPLGG